MDPRRSLHSDNGAIRIRRLILTWVSVVTVQILVSCGVSPRARFGAGDVGSQSSGPINPDESSSTPRVVTPASPDDNPPQDGTSPGPALGTNDLPATPTESDPVTPPIDIVGRAERKPPEETKDQVPLTPPVPIAGAFLLECLVSPEIPDLASVAVLCRILKNGIFDPTAGSQSAEWAIGSLGLPITWATIPGLHVPSIAGVASADFLLDRTTYAGRKIRVRHPLFGTDAAIPEWLETTLSKPMAGGALMLTGFGGVADLRGIHLGDNVNRSALDGDAGDAACSPAIADSPIAGIGVRFTFKVTSSKASVVVRLRGLCGINSDQRKTKTPFFLKVTTQGATTPLFQKNLGEGDSTVGPLSLPKGTYVISFETMFLQLSPIDLYDDVGFSSLLIMPTSGEMTTPQSVFF